MNPKYTYQILTWSEGLALLRAWIPCMPTIQNPVHLGFDAVATLMSEQASGLTPADVAMLDENGIFIELCLARFSKQPVETIVIPDCGDVSRFPICLPAASIAHFISDYAYSGGLHTFGLFDGASDVLFAFDTGDMILVDHDERVWLSSPCPIR